MNSSRKEQSFSGVSNFSDHLDFVVILLALLAASVASAIAQKTAPHQSNQIELHGTVLDSAGKPVADALVRLEQQGKSEASATTNQDGSFAFTSLATGTYLIHAEKDDHLSSISKIVISTHAPQEGIRLVIGTAAGNSEPLTSSPSAEAMEFADKPSFTVAGITDWSAVGGHGSDSSLRTSEALARETATLKPANPGTSVSGLTDVPTANESEANLRAALAQAPKSFDANHSLGEFCLRKGSYREAIAPLDTAYQIDPTNHANEYDLALAYKETGDFSRAREHVQRLLTHDDKADLHRLAGDLDEAMGDSLSAVREYEQAARLDPSEQNYFTWGSELLLHRAVWPAAEVFKQGAEAHPKSARMLAALGAALFASALYDEAALRLCDASDLNPADPAPYIFLGKIDMAAPAPLACVEPKLKRFMQEEPENARANYYYAMAIWKRQKLPVNMQDAQTVQTLLRKAVSLDPRYDDAYLQLGIFYSSVKYDFERGIDDYKKAIEVNPRLGEAHYRLGVAYERTGEIAKAKQEFLLHDEIEKQQAAAVERQRREIKQFLVVLQTQPNVH